MGPIIVWTDIPVVELDRAIAFYATVLGKEVTKQTMGEFSMGLLPGAGKNPSGCLVVSNENKPSKSGPLIYLNVSGRLDSAIAAVSSSGGTVLEGKHQIGPYGFRAIITDSEGNRIALHSPTE